MAKMIAEIKVKTNISFWTAIKLRIAGIGVLEKLAQITTQSPSQSIDEMASVMKDIVKATGGTHINKPQEPPDDSGPDVPVPHGPIPDGTRWENEEKATFYPPIWGPGLPDDKATWIIKGYKQDITYCA